MRPIAAGTAAAFPPPPVAAPCLLQTVAVQAPVEERYRIPVPSQQGKIEVGGEKTFADGKVTVKVTAIETGSIEVVVNGGEPSPVKASELTLFQISDAEMCTVVFLGKSGKKAIVAARCDPITDELKAAKAEQAAHRGAVVQTRATSLLRRRRAASSTRSRATRPQRPRGTSSSSTTPATAVTVATAAAACSPAFQ